MENTGKKWFKAESINDREDTELHVQVFLFAEDAEQAKKMLQKFKEEHFPAQSFSQPEEMRAIHVYLKGIGKDGNANVAWTIGKIGRAHV